MSAFNRHLVRGLLVTALFLIPAPGMAQSILSTQGLGFPLEPLDARSRSMGSVGTGLFGGALAPLDPASATGLIIPTVNLTLQPYWSEGTMGGEVVEGQGMRFPLVGLAYPVGTLRAMVSLTLGGYMDQRWEVSTKGTDVVAGETIHLTNLYRSEGGVSTIRVGWAQMVGRTLSLSAGVGYHTGSVTRTYIRGFDSLSVKTAQIKAYSDGGKWKYGGSTGSVGAVWDPVELLRLSGSITWNGSLEAEPSDVTEGAAATYELPVEYRVGASGVLTSRLSLTFGMSYADWASSPDGLGEESVVGAIMSFGGGLEWEGRGFGSRTLPIRLGLRRSDLPFQLDGESPIETILSGGLGLNLTQADEFVLAGIDFGLERGKRETNAFSEDFWRGTMTFRVSGW
jgi:hypothetical protein